MVLFGAHALAYFIVGVLPDAALVALGLQSANAEIVAAFQRSETARDYLPSLMGLARGDWGLTLDRVPVLAELSRAVALSAPRILGATVLIAALVLGTGYARRPPRILFAVISFLPPYVIAFLALLFLLVMQQANPDALPVVLAATLAIAVAPAMLLAEQAALSTRRNLDTDFARTLRALGATPRQVCTKLLPNLTVELTPSIEKALVALLGSLMFVEPILGLPGLGTTTVRAVRRADPELLIGLTVWLATAVAFSRLAGLLIRRQFRLPL